MLNTSNDNNREELLPEIPYPSETPPPLKASPAFIEQQRQKMAQRVSETMKLGALTNEKIEAWLAKNEKDLGHGLAEMFRLEAGDAMNDNELIDFVNELTPENLKSPAVLFAPWFGRLEGQGKKWPEVGEEVAADILVNMIINDRPILHS